VVEEEKEPDYETMTDAEIDALFMESKRAEKPEGEEGEEAEAANEEEKEPEDDGMDDDQRQAMYVEAMRDVLGSHRGACVLDGTFFKDLTDDSVPEEAKEGRKLHILLKEARRLPDLAIVLKCKHDVAVRNELDLDAIDKAHAERVAAYLKLVAEAEERIEKGEEDVQQPEKPEDLILPEEDEETKESDREKEKFVEKKKAEQESLKEFAQALKDARVPVQKVTADRGEEPTHKGVRWYCRPFMEQRASLLVRNQMVKASPSRTADLEARALAFPATFERANPGFVDAPAFSGRPDAFKYATEFRNRLYFPRSEAEQQQLLERPQDFLHLAKPSRVMVNPAVAVCGPPLAGKTLLARKLAESTGAVYLSVSEVIRQLCERAALPCPLSKRIRQSVYTGSLLSDADAVEALRHRISAPDVLKQGWILDDFPCTESQARLLTDAGIVPHRILILDVPEHVVFARSKEVGMADKEGKADLVQQEIALQRQRLDAFARTKPLVRAFYELTFANVRDLDGAKSPWAIYDQALRETSVSVSQRLEYYRRTAQGMAASLFGMCFTRERLMDQKSAWEQYCPVTLTLGNELLACQDPRYIVEYKSMTYWLASKENVGLFLDDPEAFLQVPLPIAVPKVTTPAERRNQPARQLDGYCAVALVDRKEIVKASEHLTVFYQQKWWGLENKEACSKFMRRPMRYVSRAKLPSKKPANEGDSASTLLNALTKGHDGKLIEPAEMLTFMQSSVAEMICQALVESGERRPLYPGRSAQDSALLFLARYLKAKNPLNTEMFALTVREQFRDYLADCALPEQLKELVETPEDAWNGSDERRLGELCQRFDELFKLG
jgi:adenylate kinase family enzyme/YHS domain-containing protein